MAKFDDIDLKEYTYTIIKGELKESCIICKEMTRYIDYCCEARVCSEECYNDLTKRISIKK